MIGIELHTLMNLIDIVLIWTYYYIACHVLYFFAAADDVDVDDKQQREIQNIKI